MLTMEYIKENEKTYQVQIEELTNRVEYEQRRNQRKDKKIERLQKELEFEKSIKKEVREYIANSFITGNEIFRTEILEILDKENN